MTESQFIEQNKESWEKLERLLKLPVKDADKLNDLFIKVSGDLSYARTFFPNRSVRLYLNNLTQEVFDSMRIKRKKSAMDKFKLFFTDILPYEIYQSRFPLIISFIVFWTAAAIGVFSCMNNPEFPTLILGEDYIAITEENISKGDPMAIYKDPNEIDMFLAISTNNIQVSFLAFVMGFFGTIGTVFVLISNGIMLGTFQFFFYQKGLFMTSFLTIWIHGTIEIASIIVAGGAGIVLGNGLLFPKTFNRGTSLRIAGRRALRIILGLIPLFILAALLESYVTRMTDLPDSVKWFIILTSAGLIISYFIILPWYKYKSGHFEGRENLIITPAKEERLDINKNVHRNLSQVFSVALAEFRTNIGQNLKEVVLPIICMSGVGAWLVLSNLTKDLTVYNYFTNILNVKNGGYVYMLTICFSIAIAIMYLYKRDFQKLDPQYVSFGVFTKKYGLFFLLACLCYTIALYITPGAYKFVFLLVIPPHVLFNLLDARLESNRISISESITFSYSFWGSYFIIHIFCLIIIFAIWLLLEQSLVNFVVNFISWHEIFDNYLLNEVFMSNMIWMLSFTLTLPLMYYLCSYQYSSKRCHSDLRDLNQQLEAFGKRSNIFE